MGFLSSRQMKITTGRIKQAFCFIPDNVSSTKQELSSSNTKPNEHGKPRDQQGTQYLAHQSTKVPNIQNETSHISDVKKRKEMLLLQLAQTSTEEIIELVSEVLQGREASPSSVPSETIISTCGLTASNTSEGSRTTRSNTGSGSSRSSRRTTREILLANELLLSCTNQPLHEVKRSMSSGLRIRTSRQHQTYRQPSGLVHDLQRPGTPIAVVASPHLSERSQPISSSRWRQGSSPLSQRSPPALVVTPRLDGGQQQSENCLRPSKYLPSATAFRLLKNVFPAETLLELQWELGNTIATQHASATVFFSDIVGFTDWCAQNSPTTVIECLSAYFQILDDLAEQFGIYKVETIGDAWMAVCGAPQREEHHADTMGHFALEVLETLEDLKEIFHSPDISMRIGIHCGPVVCGVVRADRPRWQLFGDTVNMASRMESTSLPGHIQISREMYDELKKSPRTEFVCEPRGQIEIKGKGSQETFFLTAVEKEIIHNSRAAQFHAGGDRLSIFNPQSSPVRHAFKYFAHKVPSVQVRSCTISNPLEVGLLARRLVPHQTELTSIVPDFSVRSKDDFVTGNYLRQKSILIVDNLASILMQYRRVLKRTGFTIYTAQNSCEALKLLKARQYTVVLMGLDVSNVDGYQCLQDLREWESKHRECWSQPIIALTRDEIPIDTQRELSTFFGIDAYMKKHANKSTLISQVMTWILSH